MTKEKKSFLEKFLDFVEKGGNKLPHPFTLFWILCLIIIVISAIAAKSGASVTYTALDRKTMEIKETTLEIKSLLNAAGIRYIFSSMVGNFTGFAPLG
ncbi:AbgT family transporter, partial [Fusobacterium sp.]